MKGKQSLGWTIVGIVIAFAIWYFQQKQGNAIDQDGQARYKDSPENARSNKKPTPPSSRDSRPKPKPKSGGNPKTPTKRNPITVSEADTMLRVAKVTGKGFTVLKGCRLVSDHRGNDGDSFLVKHPKGETEFRIYYVDTPESSYKTYRDGNNNGKRLADQGRALGGLSRDHTTEVGKVAKKYTAKLLRGKLFTVVTKWEDVYTPERKYAFVLIDFDGEKRYLHEILVAKGLGRIYTRGASLPDGTQTKKQKAHLRSMEKAAREGKVGAWSIKK